MSETPPATAPSPPKKSGALQSLIYGVVAVVVIAAGVSKTWRGVSAMFGWDGTAAFNSLLVESDASYKEALKQAEVAAPPFKSLMDAVDAQPLPDARLEQGDNGKQAVAAFTEAAKQFALSGKKIEEALGRGIELSEAHTKSLRLRSRGCALLAQVCQQDASICKLALDDSISTKEALVAQVLELAAKRDAIQQEADAAIVESEELAKQVASK